MSQQDKHNGTKSKKTGTKTRKPVMPALPEEIVSRKPDYQTCPKKAKLVMFLVALPISFVIGVIAHFIGIGIGYIATWFGGLPYFSFLFSAVAVPVTWLGFPFLVGMMNNELIASRGKKAYCRNPKLAKLAGLLNGLPLYFGHVLMAFLMTKHITTMALSPTLLENWFMLLDTPGVGEAAGAGGVFTYVLCAVEFILLMVSSYLGDPGHEKDDLFCEEHQAWYADWGRTRYPASMVEKLERRLTGGVPLQSVSEINYLSSAKGLELEFRRCSVDENCDVEIKATLWWDEKKVKKNGSASSILKKEVWFDAMFPSELGHAVLDELGLKLPDTVTHYRVF